MIVEFLNFFTVFLILFNQKLAGRYQRQRFMYNSFGFAVGSTRIRTWRILGRDEVRTKPLPGPQLEPEIRPRPKPIIELDVRLALW